MKKRLRKKLQVGEFFVPAFTLEATLKELDDAEMDQLYDRFIELLQAQELRCYGGWCDEHLYMTISTGPVGHDNEERRLRFLESLGSLQEIVSFNASELG
ncbi:50S ribosome-binding protein YggL [Victivallis sp. Marseille-Q1083]|uniref:50S ribosome-binding protein YggL n=1 Tax=Victivallis sp. Marseille-Q1083 TaxID=2717288 RepID=UPI00158D81F6|nr:50S ribosome-binding protein YggL [Victivallis sp. Marseille-Q1083]